MSDAAPAVGSGLTAGASPAIILALRGSGEPPQPLPITPLSTVDIKEIRSIVELMNEHGLTFLDLSHKDFHIKLKKGPDLDDLRGLMASLPTAVGVPAPAAEASNIVTALPVPTQSAPAAPLGKEITSPMVGTFYSKTAPDAPPLVNIGDAIAVGQTLCIIEAMKVMNEIKAECSGILSAVVAEDGSPVQFGDVLFRIS